MYPRDPLISVSARRQPQTNKLQRDIIMVHTQLRNSRTLGSRYLFHLSVTLCAEVLQPLPPNEVRNEA